MEYCRIKYKSCTDETGSRPPAAAFQLRVLNISHSARRGQITLKARIRTLEGLDFPSVPCSSQWGSLNFLPFCSFITNLESQPSFCSADVCGTEQTCPRFTVFLFEFSVIQIVCVHFKAVSCVLLLPRDKYNQILKGDLFLFLICVCVHVFMHMRTCVSGCVHTCEGV